MSDALRILLMDNDPNDRALVVQKLRLEFPELEVELISEANSFAQALGACNFDLVMVDDPLGWTDAQAVLRSVKSRCPDCPVIMLTSDEGEEIAVRAMKAGLDACVYKSPQFFRLSAAVWAALDKSRQSQALKESATRYYSLFDSVPVGLYCATPAGHLFDANPALAQMLGYPDRESLLAVNMADRYVDPREYMRWQTLMERDGIISGLETRLIRRDETIIWVKENGWVVHDAAGQILYYGGSLEDITERKRAEAGLAIHAREQAAVAELGQRALVGTDLPALMNEAVALVARTLEVEYCKVLELLLDGSAMLFQAGVSWKEGHAGHALADARTEPQVGYTLLTGEPVSIQGLHSQTSATEPSPFPDHSALNGTSVVIHGRSQPWGILGAYTTQQRTFTEDDVNFLQAVANVLAEAIERKQAQTALEEERALLAQRVEERTAELSTANVELARAARLKDEFLASMSHELRTPLNTILGLSEALQEQVYGSLNEEQLDSLRIIGDSGHHLLDLISDILDLSKIEAGKLELEIDIVPVEHVCQASLWLVKPVADKKHLQVSLTFRGGATTIQADQRRLKQILVNLLSNAVKFTPEGGAIGLEVVGDPERQVAHFTVWDTGIGIPQEDMGRLFQPFVQLDSSLARQYSGTGLGLSLVYRMVEMHGGGVSVESEVGKGSRFTVSLPWREQDQEAEGQGSEETERLEAEETPRQKHEETIRQRTVTVLLVEDNEANIKTFSRYLSTKGYRVVIARDGREALVRAREERLDVILMDIQLPGIDGLEVTRRIRADAMLTAIPIITLTARAMRGDRERCLEAGANDYMSKPVSLQRLIGAIEAQLNRNSKQGD
jgi:PAS domain S-box-containing protein